MHEIVKDYYGTQLQSSADLRTTACCDFTAMPEWMKSTLSRIHDEVLSRYYGCGLVVPALLKNCKVLDLGCGSGRDVYALAQLVGEHGSVVGVDMTPEQLAVAQRHEEYHRQAFNYAKSNVEFKLGYIESLGELGLADDSFDVVVSNCVINLSPDKDAALKEVYRLLKKGGEFYFSDVYSNRRVPDRVKNDALLYGECLGGALYGNDFIDLAKRHGFADPRLVESHPISITDPKLAERAEGIEFYSATYRLFKLDNLESNCEDYGQAVIYKGSIEHHPRSFILDDHHIIETGRVFPVCGNTWAMLHDTRMRDHFQFIGDFSRHFGLFDCSSPQAKPATSAAPACC
jgi:arsenite methyltransferase